MMDAEEPHKLYVLVREDLPPGLRAAQAGHAVAEICIASNKARKWRFNGNYLIVLGVPDEASLKEAYHRLNFQATMRSISWQEPDLDYAWTSAAFLPSPEQNQLFAGYPLAYRPRTSGWRGRLVNLLGGQP